MTEGVVTCLLGREVHALRHAESARVVDGPDRAGDVRHRGHTGVDQRDGDTLPVRPGIRQRVAVGGLLVDARQVVVRAGRRLHVRRQVGHHTADAGQPRDERHVVGGDLRREATDDRQVVADPAAHLRDGVLHGARTLDDDTDRGRVRRPCRRRRRRGHHPAKCRSEGGEDGGRAAATTDQDHLRTLRERVVT